MGTLSRAIHGQQWELAAYCLLLAMTKVAQRVPRESLDELLRLLAEGAHGRRA